MSHLGLTIPLGGLEVADHGAVLDAAVAHGFTDVWTSEVNGLDAMSPLVAAVTRHPDLRAGTAIVPAFTRSPGLLAMTAAGLAESGKGEVLFGIGSSSNVVVEHWNGIPFEAPYQRVRDVATFLRRALAGEKVDMECESFHVRGFRLERPPQRIPKLMIAALRPGMLRLAGRLGDGVILNWLAPTDVPRVVDVVAGAHPSGTPEVAARLFVILSEDRDRVRETARRRIAAYLNVPVYAEFHRWLGRAEVLQPMWDAWSAGDRRAALEAIPDSLVDELFIHGSPEACAARVDDYVAAGVTTPVLSIDFAEHDPVEALARMRPI